MNASVSFPSFMPKYTPDHFTLQRLRCKRGRLNLEQKSPFWRKGVYTYANRENGDRRKT